MIEPFNVSFKKYYFKVQILSTTIYNYKEMAKMYNTDIETLVRLNEEAIQEIDNTETLKSEHIEKYLSNIEVKVGIQDSNGWSVLLDNDEYGNRASWFSPSCP